MTIHFRVIQAEPLKSAVWSRWWRAWRDGDLPTVLLQGQAEPYSPNREPETVNPKPCSLDRMPDIRNHAPEA
jgi:hypothetical protein